MLIKKLAIQSGVSETKLNWLANTASQRYKVYEIPKRGGGSRTIEHPSRELKAIQRWIVKNIFNHFPIHDCATAYKKGASIRNNAERHKYTNYTTRIDFLSFFPSFKQYRVNLFLDQQNEKYGLGIVDEDIQFIGNIVCRNGRLTIGAPSSPAVTNTMMYQFDESFFRHCQERDILYTRYADDIFVSSRAPNCLGGLEEEIRKINRSIDYLALRINHKKTAYLSRKYGRRIAGIVITPDRKLSIGRHRKREIKSLIHKWLIGKLPYRQFDYLRGVLAFACDVEPDFEQRLRRKYGNQALDRVLHGPIFDLAREDRRST